METKCCSKCGIEKLLTDFYKNKKRKDGVAVYCIPCTKEYFKRDDRLKYERDRTKKRQQTKQYKEYQVKYQVALNKKKYHEDPLFRMKILLGNSIRKYINRKQKTTNEIIGCSWIELKNYFESKFIQGMTWENQGEWHIDHIIPLSSAKTEEQLYRLNHYTNLQPLWAEDNLKKSDKISIEWGNEY